MNNSYNSNPYTPAPAVSPKNIALCIILSIVTCGIYAYIWLYTLTEDTKVISGDNSLPSGIMVIVFSILTCGVYACYWTYKQGEILERTLATRGINVANQGIFLLILSAIGLGTVAYAIMQDHINKLV